MLKFKIDSLVMRIWVHFIAILLVLLVVVSGVYYLVIDRYEEGVKLEELKAGHAIFVDRLKYPGHPGRIDQGHLSRVDNFLMARTFDGKLEFFYKGPDVGKDGGPAVADNRHQLRSWMAGFTTGKTMKDEVFKRHVGTSEYVFIISSVDLANQLPAIKQSGEFETDMTDAAEAANGKDDDHDDDNTTTVEKQAPVQYYLISYADPRNDISMLYIILGVSLGVLLIGFVASKMAADNIAAPLREIEAYTTRISKKDWTGPLVIRHQDELGRLAEAMNNMQRELKRSEDEERQFLQSISHDLKTPVMVIMSHAEALLDGVHVVSAEETARVIRDEAKGLECKIRKILFLNTLDYALEHNSELEAIDLEELMKTVVSRMGPIRADVEWQLETLPVAIMGDYEKLSVAFENIIDNGLRYARQTMEVKMRILDDQVEIDLFNDGPIIPNEKLERIFEYLYKDKSGNFGLGLTISKKIVNFHKGSLSVVNREGGVSFVFRFPIYKTGQL